MSRPEVLAIGGTLESASSVHIGSMASRSILVQGHTTSAVLTIYASMDQQTWTRARAAGAAVAMHLDAHHQVLELPAAPPACRFVRLVADRELGDVVALMMRRA